MSHEYRVAKITVIGVGKTGCLAVKWLEEKKVEGLHLLYADTAESLKKQGVEGFEVSVESGGIDDPYSSPSLVSGNLALKPTPDMNLAEHQDVESHILKGNLVSFANSIFESDLLFILADLSEPLANQVVPIIAALDMSEQTTSVAIVTGSPTGIVKKVDIEIAMQELVGCVDSVIKIPYILDQRENLDVVQLFGGQNICEHLARSVQAISDLITLDGIICIDLHCVSHIFKKNGLAVMGHGVGSGADRAVMAARIAVQSEFLDGVSVGEAKGILISMAGGYDMELAEMDAAAIVIRDQAGEDCDIALGDNLYEFTDRKFSVTIFLTGISWHN